MTDLAEKVVSEEEAEATLTVGEKTYAVADLSDEVKELLGLHAQAAEMANAAKRQAVIHDLAVQNIVSLIETKLDEDDDTE